MNRYHSDDISEIKVSLDSVLYSMDIKTEAIEQKLTTEIQDLQDALFKLQEEVKRLSGIIEAQTKLSNRNRRLKD